MTSFGGGVTVRLWLRFQNFVAAEVPPLCCFELHKLTKGQLSHILFITFVKSMIDMLQK